MRQAVAVGRGHFATDAKSPDGEEQRDQQRHAARDLARRMRHVVVGIVGERKVTHDVNHIVRQHRGRSRRACAE